MNKSVYSLNYVFKNNINILFVFIFSLLVNVVGYSQVVLAGWDFPTKATTVQNVTLSQNMSLLTYCTMSGNTSYNTSITSVIFNSINQTSAKVTGYSDYTALSTDVVLGSSHNLSVRINTAGNYTCYARAWFDWNADGDFADSGEMYELGSAKRQANGLVSSSPLSITIPTTAFIGQTRMRVAMMWSDPPTLCSTGFDGEVEDYTINIVAPTISTGVINGSPFVAGSFVSVPFTVVGAFRAGNIFSAQLSDKNGSFAAPVNIGTFSGATSGTINASIPILTESGSAYRIRVVASNPSVVSSDNGVNLSVVSGTYASVSSLSAFTYKQNLGPSAAQFATFAGSALTSNIRLESVSNKFEFSVSNSPFTGSAAVVLPVVSGSVANTVVYVRLKTGLIKGAYTDSIRVTSAGYADKFVSLAGTVTASPNITAAPSSLSLGGYNFGGGPTAAQNFTVRASLLSGAVTVTPPAGFELKLSSASTYQSIALTINPDFPVSNSDSLLLKTINIRMKSGLGSGVHTGNVTVSSLGATTRNVNVTGTVYAKASILNSTSFLGAFIYTENAGPSRVQGFQLKVNDLGANSSIVITPPVSLNYEISRSRTGTYQTTAITISNVSGNFTDSIFVRLKAGLTVGSYGPEGVIITASGAVTKSVACVGKVVNAATLSTSTNTITGFGYQQANSINPPGISNNGPSNTQSFVFAGSSLTNDATITAPANFEVSYSPTSGFASSLTAGRVSGVIAPRIVYVRLVSGLGVGSFTGNVDISSTGATGIQVALASAKVYASPLVSASGGGDYCLGSTINLTSTGGSELANRFWEGPNAYYNINPNPVLSTNATAALNGEYVVTANVIVGGNLIYNGNFEQGNVGFGSAYGYPAIPFTTSSLNPEGLYAVTTTGSVVHTNFNAVADHSNPGNLQMIINGNTIAGSVVWSQNVSVLPGSDYQFSYWLQTVVNGTDGAPSKLQLYINGVSAGPIYTANPTSGAWTQYIYNTNSGSSSSLNLELINQTTDAGGNDFSLDDIELTQVLYAKDTVTVAVGSALPVSVSVVASQTNVAPNVPITFTATPTNGGTAPIYKWVVGTDTLQSSSSPTFTSSFTTNTTVKCILVSSLNCVTGNPASTNTSITITAPVNPNYWFGMFDTDWAKPVNWTDNRIPNPGEDVEYATVANYGLAAKKDLYVDDVRIVGNIINATNRKLVIPAGRQLTVNNNINFTYGVNRDSLIEIRATTPLVGGQPGAANGSLIFNNAQNNPVSATVQMYSPATWDLTRPVNQKYNWQYFGIPVRTLTAVPTFTGAYVRELIESDKDTATHWRSLTDNSVLIPFKGYELCQNTTKMYTFKGQLVNDNFNSGQFVKTAGALYPGQHLFANPYTCAIDIKFIEFGSGVEATAYLYNTGSFNSWRSNPVKNDQGLTIVPGQYNSVPKNQAGEYGLFSQIPSMGTFMVRIPIGSPSTAQSYVAVNYSAVASKNTDRQRVLGYSVTKDQTSTLISVEGESGADKVWLMSHETYTRDFDNGFDGKKLAGLALNPQLYAVERDNKYQINSIDNLNNTSLAFQAGIDTKYSISIKNNPLVFQTYQRLYLHDLVEDNVINILVDSITYDFRATTTVDPVVRFKILAQKYEEANGNEIVTQVYRAENTIRVQNFSKYSGRVYVYDMLGKTIAIKEIAGTENISIPVQTKLAYVIKAVIGDKTETTKLILE